MVEEIKNTGETDNIDIPSELRLGHLGRLLFCYTMKGKMPKHLDLLDFFFPDLLVHEEASAGIIKSEAIFDDDELMIHAERHNGSLYVGGSTRVSQIIARLIGTARGGQEKERQTASRIRSKLADQLTLQHYPVAVLLKYWREALEELPDEAVEHFLLLLSEYIDRIEDHHMNHPEQAHAEECPITEDIYAGFQTRLINAWNTDPVFAFAWLLFGALLRNEISRMVLRYTCDFCFFDEAASMPDMDTYEEDFYEGDDLEKRFPGVEWFCDRCGDRLDLQPGFDDHQRIWKCIKCGYKNPIEITEIYNSDEDWKEKRGPVDPERFYRALKRRSDELDALV
jgi:hypothetical protein